MRTSLSPLLVVGALLAISAFPASAAVTSPDASGPSSLHVELDGTPAGILEEWSGGDQVLTYTSDLSALSGVNIVPLQLGLPADPSPVLQSLIRDFLQGVRAPHVCRMEEWAGDKPKPLTRADGTVVSELRLCALDAAEVKSSGSSLFLVLKPGSVRPDSGKVLIKDTGKARRTRGNFSIRVSGGAIPSASDVSRIRGYSDIVIRSEKGGPAKVGPIVLRIHRSFGASFEAWRDAVLAGDVTGNRRQMTLDFLDASAKGVQLSFVFSEVLPVRVARSADGSLLEVELTAKSVALATAPAASVPETTAASAPAEPGASTPATPDAPVPPRVPTVSPVAPLADRTVKAVADLPALAAPVSSGIAEGADQGLRDPKDFYRPVGLLRVSFLNSDYVTSSTEQASYSSKRTLQELLDDYFSRLTKDGWSRTSGSDSGSSPETRMAMSTWERGHTKADLRLYATKAGCNVSILIEYRP